MDTINTNLISVTRHMQNILQELNDADVKVLSVRIDMNYDTVRPHLFRYHIHAWKDENFDRWAEPYHTDRHEQRHEISVPFIEGQVYVLYD